MITINNDDSFYDYRYLSYYLVNASESNTSKLKNQEKAF